MVKKIKAQHQFRTKFLRMIPDKNTAGDFIGYAIRPAGSEPLPADRGARGLVAEIFSFLPTIQTVKPLNSKDNANAYVKMFSKAMTLFVRCGLNVSQAMRKVDPKDASYYFKQLKCGNDPFRLYASKVGSDCLTAIFDSLTRSVLDAAEEDPECYLMRENKMRQWMNNWPASARRQVPPLVRMRIGDAASDLIALVNYPKDPTNPVLRLVKDMGISQRIWIAKDLLNFFLPMGY